jgi:ABC-type Zn uptake system ZnuABC Zn-binding protein ZnuA/ABC-type Mn2+/Zn2+ transport system permease subunit
VHLGLNKTQSHLAATIAPLFEPFQHPYVQRGLIEVLLLAVAGGLLGTWVVLRGLAFYAHAVGTAAFPGLVLAEGLGFAAQAGAFGTAVLFAGGVTLLSAGRRSDYGSLTALVLVGCLAGGVILASDVFHSGSNVETLLFGSLLVIDGRDIALAAVAAGLALVAGLVVGRRWLAIGFDPESAPALGVRSRAPDLLLLLLIALATTAALAAVGALLTTAIFVVPAATARLWVHRVETLQLTAIALAAAEGVVGLWLSVHTNAPPGATIAIVAGFVFALSAIVKALPRGARPASVAAAAAVAVMALAGCGGGSGGSDSRVSVVATTTQVADFVRTVGGDAVDVHQLLQPNSDPHEYEPRPADIEKTADADIVFTSGDGLDAWIGDVVSEAGGHPTVVDLGASVPVKLPGEAQGSEASKYDPHWWHDPVNAEAAVAAVGKALSKARPAERNGLEQRAVAYQNRLRDLDKAIRGCFASVPLNERKLVSDHDAFNYFVRRYKIRFIGAVIPSQTTVAQPSARDVAKLIALIKREHVRAIFPESSLNPNLANAIAEQTGAISNLTLYGDTLGPSNSTGSTYPDMLAANADAMVRGFTGKKRGCTPGA